MDEWRDDLTSCSPSCIPGNAPTDHPTNTETLNEQPLHIITGLPAAAWWQQQPEVLPQSPPHEHDLCTMS